MIRMIALSVFLFVSCSGEAVHCADTVGSDLSADASGDETSDVARLDPLESLCPTGPATGTQTHLIPAPRAVFHLGAPVPIESPIVSWEGTTQPLEKELQRLSADFGLAAGNEGALHVVVHSDGEWASLLEVCGFDVPAEEAFYLAYAVADGRGTAHVFGDSRGRFYAVKTLRQLVSAQPVSVRPARILDYPAARIRGVVEGFYGPPWDKDDRLAMLPLLADLKMNTYVYAPKDDVWIGVAWMQPFPESELKHMREMVDVAARQRIRLCWELHIGWALTFSSQNDMDLMVAKFDAIGQQGIDCFVVAFDDVNKFMPPADEKVYDSYPQAQADFGNRLAQQLKALYPDSLLAFVPVEYWTDHEDTLTDLAWLGENLVQDWMIAWTGAKIVSTTITQADADEIAAILQRPALLGDNYPVSDAGGGGEVLLGPLVGREAGVVAATSGAVFNPMPLAFASLPALATTADWAWNPEAYQPMQSTTNAALLYAGEERAEAVAAFFLANRSPILESSNAPELKSAMDAFLEAADYGSAQAAAEALETGFFYHFAALESVIASDELHPCLAELVPWMDVLVRYTQACRKAVELLVAAAGGGAPEAAQLAELSAEAQELALLEARPTGGVMRQFLEDCLARLGTGR